MTAAQPHYLHLDPDTLRVSINPREPDFVQDPYAAYAFLHETAPAFFWKEYGFWCFAGYDDVNRLLRDRRLGRENRWGPPGIRDETRAHLEAFDTVEVSSLLELEPPVHTRLRALVNRAFVSRQVERLRPRITQLAHQLVDKMEAQGSADLLPALATPVPITVIAEMLGVPADQREAVAKAAEKLFGMSDDEYSSLEERAEATINEMFVLANTGIELAKFRRRHPGDDLMTAIVNAEIDGHRLTDEEIGAFLILLASAGNDTTKQTTSHAMLALAAHPDQRDWLTADFENRIGPAVEEFIRWATPVLQFARTVTADTELAGQPLRAGDKVGLFYCSANRDESAFDRPQLFDVRRSPNPHLGFGGGGPHFCLGNQLARTELRNLFRELLTRLSVEFGEPEYLMSNFVHGIKRLPASIR